MLKCLSRLISKFILCIIFSFSLNTFCVTSCACYLTTKPLLHKELTSVDAIHRETPPLTLRGCRFGLNLSVVGEYFSSFNVDTFTHCCIATILAVAKKFIGFAHGEGVTYYVEGTGMGGFLGPKVSTQGPFFSRFSLNMGGSSRNWRKIVKMGIFPPKFII